MRFLILTQYYPPEIGAAQLRLSSLARQLKAFGHDVEVVTALPNHPTGKIFDNYRGHFYVHEEVDGIPVHRVWLYAATGAGIRRIANYLSFCATALFALVRCRRPDYVFVESPPLFLSMTGALGAKLWGAKMIFNVADLWPDSVRELGLMREGLALRMADRLEGWSYRVADRVSSVTEGLMDLLEKRKGVPAKKLVFLPNGVDTELFRPRALDTELAEELGLTGKSVMLYAGTHGFAHGADVILDVASRLVDRTDLAFVFVGGGSEKAKLVEVARQRGLTNVLFLEPSPPEYVARLYSLAAAGLSTLRDSPLSENIRPVKIFACMASGVPVIYSGAGEGARLVQEARAGVITPAGDATALAEAVLRIAGDQSEAQQLGSNGRQYVETMLSWKALVGTWLAQLQDGADSEHPRTEVEGELE